MTIAMSCSTLSATTFHNISNMEDGYAIWADTMDIEESFEPSNDDDILWSDGRNLSGLRGDDIIQGGNSDNTFYGGDGNDMMFGNGGDDNMSLCQPLLAGGHDIIYFGAGNDRACDNIGHNWYFGGHGDDEVYLPEDADNGYDETYYYTAGHDTINLGKGYDTLVIKNIPYNRANEWQFRAGRFAGTFDNPSASLFSTKETKNGYIVGPNGNRIDFKGVEDIKITYSYPLQFTGLSDDPEVKATIVSGLPEGFAIEGRAQTPQLGEDGTWFQAVNADELRQGILKLIPTKGYFGELNLDVFQVKKINHGYAEVHQGQININIKPTNDGLLFVELGSLDLENRHIRSLPLHIVMNGKLTAPGQFATAYVKLPEHFKLHNAQGELQKSGLTYPLSPKDLKGLRIINLHGEPRNFTLDVTMNGLIDGQYITASQTRYVPALDIVGTDNRGRVLKVPGRIEDFNVTRIGNNIAVTHITQSIQKFSIKMIDVDYLEFDNGFISTKEYVKYFFVTRVLNQVTDPENTLLIVSNVPESAVVNNAFYLGNGAYGIPVTDIREQQISLDYMSLGDEISFNLQLSAVTMTQQQSNTLSNQTRISGYQNAEIFARTGANASFIAGSDGISLEARAYVEAGTVATAGGSIGGLNGEASAQAGGSSGASVSVLTTDTQSSISAYVGAEVGASTTGTVNVEQPYIPGTEASVEGSVGVTATAYVNARQDVVFDIGNGELAIHGEGGAEFGAFATADGYAFSMIAGVGGGAGGGVSAGPGVSVNGGGYAAYDNGTVSFGASGELALLLGAEFDFDVVIDANAVLDTATFIGRGVITGSEAISGGYIEAAEGIRRGYISAIDAINAGFIEAETAVQEGLISAEQAINRLNANASYLADYGYSRTQRQLVEAASDTVRFVQNTNVNRITKKARKKLKKKFRKIRF